MTFYACRGCGHRFKTWAKTREHHLTCLPFLVRNPVPHVSCRPAPRTEAQEHAFNRPGAGTKEHAHG